MEILVKNYEKNSKKGVKFIKYLKNYVNTFLKIILGVPAGGGQAFRGSASAPFSVPFPGPENARRHYNPSRFFYCRE